MTTGQKRRGSILPSAVGVLGGLAFAGLGFIGADALGRTLSWFMIGAGLLEALVSALLLGGALNNGKSEAS
ncbi:hypothetical protein [Caulobacter soli]|uniref:hypothetical protein n=1 Tax=Caulobacter soli TaxID=2708539 RepID=UPI0013EBD71C|nr:hypothetical protein [Caulobacter soli]